MRFAATAVAAGVAGLIFFAPEIASSMREEHLVPVAGRQGPKVIFIPPPVHVEQRKTPVMVDAPPLLAPEAPLLPAKPLPILPGPVREIEPAREH